MLSFVRFNKTKKRNFICASRLLAAERAALGKTGLATGGLAKNGRAAGADNNGLGVGEDSGDGEAAGALDVHEEGAGLGHKGLQSNIQVSILFVFPGEQSWFSFTSALVAKVRCSVIPIHLPCPQLCLVRRTSDFRGCFVP
jgi:hypothetical protein